MQLLFLGTGTSTGVPVIGCDCPTCRSLDPCDKRLRTSALLTVGGKNLLIDCGPDFRQQMLRAHSPHIDAILITHEHSDHMAGIDDLRPYSMFGSVSIYCQPKVAQNLRERYPYCFAENPYPGVPKIDLYEIDENAPFTAAGIEVTPLPVLHGKLPIVGYRVGDLAYITDCKTMPERTIALIKGVKTLVINALRIEEHPTHLNLEQSIALARQIGAERVYFTHMSDGMPPAGQVQLPEGFHLAHDFLAIHNPQCTMHN